MYESQKAFSNFLSEEDTKNNPSELLNNTNKNTFTNPSTKNNNKSNDSHKKNLNCEETIAFVEFIHEIIPYLKELSYLKNFYHKFLKELIQEALQALDLNAENNNNNTDKLFKSKVSVDEILLKNLLALFLKISQHTEFITTNGILFYIGCFIIQNDDEIKKLTEKLTFQPDHAVNFTKEAEKLIILFDKNLDNKLNFEEFLNFFEFKKDFKISSNDIKINGNAPHCFDVSYLINKLFLSSPDRFSDELIVIENENLNFIFIKLLCDYLKFINFLNRKVMFFNNVMNLDSFDIFLILDKKNNNYFTLEDLKNFLFNAYAYENILLNTQKPAIEALNTTRMPEKLSQLKESDIKLFFNFLNIFKRKEKYNIDDIISVIEFERVFSINKNFKEEYDCLKSLKISNNFKNLDSINIAKGIKCFSYRNKSNVVNMDFIDKDNLTSNLSLQSEFNKNNEEKEFNICIDNIDNNIVNNNRNNPLNENVENLYLTNNKSIPNREFSNNSFSNTTGVSCGIFKQKISLFYDYLTIYVQAEEVLEKLRFKLAYNTNFNPKLLYIYLTCDVLAINQNNLNLTIPNQVNDTNNISINTSLNKIVDNYHFSGKISQLDDIENNFNLIDNIDSPNYLQECKLLYINTIDEKLKGLEIFLTPREIELFCSCFNYSSLEKFLMLFISNFENPKKLIYNRIISDDNNSPLCHNNYSLDNVALPESYEYYSKIYFTEETRKLLHNFVENLISYENKKEFLRKKIYEHSENNLELFHYLDREEKGYLVEKDVRKCLFDFLNFFIFLKDKLKNHLENNI